MHFAEQKYKLHCFNNKEMELKMQNSTHTLVKWTFCFSSYKNRELKVKLMSWSSRRKKECIFCNFYFVRRKFFNICVLSQYILYWINFQNTYTFTHQKTLLHTLLLLVFKIVGNLQSILETVFVAFINSKHKVSD